MKFLSERANQIFRRGIDHFFVTYLGLWKREDPRKAEETTAVSGVLVGAMIEVLTTIALDLGMSVETLQAALKESYDRAIKKAPKWG